jgi:arylsulfatase A-like enzyme
MDMLLDVAAALSLAAPSVTGAARTPHNVVLIVLDDVGAELVGSYDAYFLAQGRPTGAPAATPALDQMLAPEALMFTHAWSMPSCSPSRAAMLTGRFALRNGVGGVTAARPLPNRNGLTAAATLLPQVLHAAPLAYTCAAVGKWHLADNLQLAADPRHPLGSPPGQWFDRWAGSYFAVNAPDGYSQVQYAYSVWTKSYATEIDVTSAPCAPLVPPCQIATSTPPLSNYATVDTAEDALTFMAQAAEPYFLYVAFNAIHRPLHDVPLGLPEPTCGGYVPPVPRCDNPYGLSADHLRARCMLESLDAQVGRLLCAIDAADTTVIVAGDNGTAREVCTAPYTAAHAKGSVYDGGVRVPLFVRSPWISPSLRGTQVDAPVHLVDVFATVCELAGVDPATTPGVDSVSLAPYFSGAPAQRQRVYTEDFFPNFVPDPATGGAPAGFAAKHHTQAIGDGRYKLIRKWRQAGVGVPPNLTESLYCFVQGAPDPSGNPVPPDPFEQRDLLALGPLSGEAAQALAKFRQALDEDYPRLVP